MVQEHKTAFVSYSWDSPKHQNWVMHFVNALKNQGVAAEIDVFVTQQGTVNLNNMMVSKIRDSDYTIIVLTENYAEKSDKQQGGVGFETTLTLPLLQQSQNRIILILRDGNYDVSVPFHLKGYYILDFRNDEEFDSRLKELLHKIYNVPLYEVQPLGEIPDLTPKKVEYLKNINPFDEIEIPNLRTHTDLDKERFLQKNFEEIQGLFNSLFMKVKETNDSFDFIEERIHNKKVIYKIYLNGQQRTAVKIWTGGLLGQGINLLYGNHYDVNNDGTTNETIRCEVNNQNELQLRMTMHFGNVNASNPKDIVLEIWKHQIQPYLV
ncbi:toll/interleukin-1 receptor domain-containing protein [Fictibacillus enclensis]|uniref:toll/interleukin-1 receptor domain-containing protein n=1 Tax=Fictibacillus enclensis TaxID=1017270 RepID=UPI0025A27F88|nr:toll/interleukin-1 receptor domain-containing protein [Fictibacillus enclensis]MDM5338503.1 toll/interleukin-1 receptor domain-containing protein [Fictibacillus enclensis]